MESLDAKIYEKRDKRLKQLNDAYIELRQAVIFKGAETKKLLEKLQRI